MEHTVQDQVIIGLSNKQIVPGILAADHKDEDELLHSIQEFERVYGQVNGQSRWQSRQFADSHKWSHSRSPAIPVQNVSSSVHMQSSINRTESTGATTGDAVAETIDSSSSADEKRKRRGLSCYFCKGARHLRRNCPKRKLSPEAAHTSVVQSSPAAVQTVVEGDFMKKWESEYEKIPNQERFPLKMYVCSGSSSFIRPAPEIAEIAQARVRSG
ncbi:unnamed protein product [Phaedon cochleariae]|uniref:CCHC-type domain-containing protein n=1 Tax=Phaedon cochleariae TaxID=80249 RepID=A0A9N9SIS1_PHACE|nr:unnamed protein product [Phaedon cochleariae]